MPLVDLELNAGFYSEQSPRGSKGRWRDGSLVRFRHGLPEKLKGWIAYEDSTETPIDLAAPIRAMHSWSSLDNQKWFALASPQKLYIVNNDQVFDITPLEDSGTLTDPFTTTLSSADVTVTHTDHGVQEGQLVRFSGASAVGGITIDGDYTVDSVTDENNYVIVHSSAATSGATGGGSVSYEYEITPAPGASQLLGYGIGPYGQDDDPNYVGSGYGTARLAQNLPQHLSVWSLDNWGEDLMATRLGGYTYVWDRSSGTGTRAQRITNAPTATNWMRVSPENRQVISFGSHDGTQRDQSLIRWSSVEDYDDWTASETNTAGDKRLDSGSRIITAVRTRGEIVVFTDRSVYSMSPSDVAGDYDFRPLGESLRIVGPNAAIEAGGVIYAMMYDEFVAYDGVTRILPCTVRSFVFDDIDREDIEKVYAAVNKQESEVWWFYPSNGAAENDRYVIFNYREGAWYYGSMNRTAYIDVGFKDYPIAADENGALFLHENGYLNNTAQMPAYIESYDTEIPQAGDDLMFIRQCIPDFKDLAGSVEVTLKCRKYPRAEQIIKGPYAVSSSTESVDLRARGRQIAVRIDDVTTVGNAADVLELPAGSSLSLSGGNLAATQGADGAWDAAFGDDGRTTSGKYVFEIALSAPGATDPYTLFIGIADDNTANVDRDSPGGVTLKGFNGDDFEPKRVTVYVDFDEGDGWIEVDGVWLDGDVNVPGSTPSFTFTAASTWYPAILLFNSIAATYRSTAAAIEADIPDGWLPWAGVTETGVTTPSWRYGTMRFDVKPDGRR